MKPADVKTMPEMWYKLLTQTLFDDCQWAHEPAECKMIRPAI